MPLDCSSGKAPGVRRLLVLDSSYSLEAIRERRLETSVICRDLGGFFEHVWTVHPFASLVTSKKWAPPFGRPEAHELAPAHTFIEGKVGRFSWLRWFPALNFLISQIDIVFRLSRLVHKKRITAIRTGDPLYNGFLGWVISRLCGIPLLVRVGGNFDKNYEVTGKIGFPQIFRTRRIEKIFERFVFSRADIVACANKDYVEFAFANGAKPQVTTLFRYGNLIDKNHLIDPRDRPSGRALLRGLGVEPGRFLLTIARLEPLKHPDDVVRVLTEVRRRGYDVKLILAGDGQLREALSKLAGELGVKDHVVFCGNRDQEWLARIIPLAAVVVSPLMGRALTEAVFGAAPVVAYDLDWQSELIQTGVTGELVPAFKWEEMADAVERFLADPGYARAMGDAVRKLALEMMDPEALDQHERDTYLKLFMRTHQKD